MGEEQEEEEEEEEEEQRMEEEGRCGSPSSLTLISTGSSHKLSPHRKATRPCSCFPL